MLYMKQASWLVVFSLLTLINVLRAEIYNHGYNAMRMFATILLTTGWQPASQLSKWAPIDCISPILQEGVKVMNYKLPQTLGSFSQIHTCKPRKKVKLINLAYHITWTCLSNIAPWTIDHSPAANVEKIYTNWTVQVQLQRLKLEF